MAINRGTFDKLSTLKSQFPVVDSGDYAEVLETQITYVFSGSGWNPGTPAAYTNNFIELKDVPDSYVGKNSAVPVVNAEETGLEFKYVEGVLGFTPENEDNKVSSFQITPDDDHYPSEKLVKDQLNLKVNIGDPIVAPGVSKFGTATDYSEFETDGTLKFNGDAEVWDDIIISASNLRPGNTPPVYAAFQGGIFGARFDAGVADEVYGSFEIPHDYKEGGDLYFHVHWSPTTTNTGNIVWGIEYTVGNMGAVFSTNDTKTGTPTAAPGTVGKHEIKNIYIIPGESIKIGAIIAFRLFRQNGGTDTFTGNAFLHSVGIHYQIDTIGSREITTK
jgi:hypothetical protein